MRGIVWAVGILWVAVCLFMSRWVKRKDKEGKTILEHYYKENYIITLSQNIKQNICDYIFKFLDVNLQF